MAPFPSPSEHLVAMALLRLTTRDISTDEIRVPKVNVKYSCRRTRSKRLVSGSGWNNIKLSIFWKDPMHRKAEAILKLLSAGDSGGCLREVKIRQKIGDSPDTSKALRMLLKLEKVKRVGTGGRHQPYVYTIS